LAAQAGRDDPSEEHLVIHSSLFSGSQSPALSDDFETDFFFGSVLSGQFFLAI
jgi:hypothetical protein